MLFTSDLSRLTLVPEGFEGNAVLPAEMATVPACVFSRCIKLTAITVANAKAGSTAASAFISKDGILYSRNEDGETLTLIAAPAGLGASASIASSCTRIAEGAFTGNASLRTIIASGAVEDIAAGDGTASPVPAFDQQAIAEATVLADERSAWERAGFTRFSSSARPGDSTTLAPDESGFIYTLMEDGHLSVRWAGDAPATGERTIVESATLHGVNYTVTAIEDGALRGQSELTALVLPDTIASIGANAFEGCTALTSMSIPGSVRTIGEAAFEGCASLTEIALNQGTATISERAFAGTAIEDLTLPASVEAIGDAAFDGCASLSCILLLGAPVSVSSSALGSATGVAIYAPAADAPVWPVLPASGNTLHEYAMQAPASPLELTVGEEADLLAQEGALLKASGDIEIDCSYKGASIYADATGIVKAKAPGTSPVTAALTLDGTELAKATAVVIVRAAPAPVGEVEGEDAQGEVIDQGSSSRESNRIDIFSEEKDMGLHVESGMESEKKTSHDSTMAVASIDAGLTVRLTASTRVLVSPTPVNTLLYGEPSKGTYTVEFYGNGGQVSHYCEGYAAGYSKYHNEHGHLQVKKGVNFYKWRYNTDGNLEKTFFRITESGFAVHDTIVQSGNACAEDYWNKDQQEVYKTRLEGVRTGYKFIGWSFFSSGKDEFGRPQICEKMNLYNHNASDILHPFGWENKLYAQYEPNKYTIKFDGNGATSGSTSDISATYDQNVKLVNGYAKTGHSFAGWALAPTGSKVYDENATVKNLTDKANGVVTLYALWTPLSYAIKFVNEDGSVLQESQWNYGTTPTCNTTPTKAATAQHTYTHSGWSPSITTVVGSQTYKATFKETVRSYPIKFYDYNAKGELRLLQETQVAYGSSPVYDTKNGTPFKPSTAELNYSWNNAWNPAVTAVTGAASYTATFTETKRSYTIRFLNHDGAVLQSGSLEYGAKPSYSGNTPTKPSDAQYSYAFSGWSPAITSVTGAKDYRAQFTSSLRTYFISYSLDGGTNPSDQYTSYTYQSDDFTLKEPSRPGCDFEGWTGSGFIITPQKLVTISKGSSGDRNYNANWEILSFRITYDWNGSDAFWNGSLYPPTYTVVTDTITLGQPKRPGYTFTGWTITGASSIEGGGTTDGVSAQIKKGTYGHLTAKAGWSPDEHTIAYDYKGGSLPKDVSQPHWDATDKVSKYNIETATFTLANPARPGYTFTGWTITGASAIAGGGVVNGTSAQVKKGTYGNLTATANWTPNVYTVSFDKNVGDTGDNVKDMPESFTIKFSEPSLADPGNQTVTLSSSVPKRVGYTFDGWRLQGTDSTGTQVDTVYQPGAAYRHPFAGDISFSAQWIENDGFRVSFYKFTGDAEDERIPFAPDYANLSYEDRFQLPGRGDVPDNDKVSGYYLYGWSYSKDAGADGSAEATTFTLPVSPTLDDRVSVRILLDKLGIEPGEDEPKDIKLYAVWQMVYSITCPTDSTAAIVLDASEKQVMRASEVALTSTTPAEIAVGAKSEYNASTFEKVFPDTRVRDVGFAFTEQGSSEEKYFPLTGSSPYGWVSWQGEDIIASELTRIPKGSGASGPAARREATLSLDFNPNSVNISHELQYEDGTMLHDEDGNEQTGSGLLMNGTRWKDPIARITWMFKPVEASALTYTLLPSMPAAGSAPGHGTGAIEADARPFEGD